jgi:hypothetical protein
LAVRHLQDIREVVPLIDPRLLNMMVSSLVHEHRLVHEDRLNPDLVNQHLRPVDVDPVDPQLVHVAANLVNQHLRPVDVDPVDPQLVHVAANLVYQDPVNPQLVHVDPLNPLVNQHLRPVDVDVDPLPPSQFAQKELNNSI